MRVRRITRKKIIPKRKSQRIENKIELVSCLVEKGDVITIEQETESTFIYSSPRANLTKMGKRRDDAVMEFALEMYDSFFFEESQTCFPTAVIGTFL